MLLGCGSSPTLNAYTDYAGSYGALIVCGPKSIAGRLGDSPQLFLNGERVGKSYNKVIISAPVEKGDKWNLTIPKNFPITTRTEDFPVAQGKISEGGKTYLLIKENADWGNAISAVGQRIGINTKTPKTSAVTGAFGEVIKQANGYEPYSVFKLTEAEYLENCK